MIQNQQLGRRGYLDAKEQHVWEMAQRRVYIKKELFWASLAYTTLAFIITWPLVPQLFKAVGGFEGRDSFQHVWLFWWFWEALLNKQQLPAEVSVLYFPQGSSHPVLWLHALIPLLGLPLTNLLGPTATYNLFLLFSFVITGIAGYLLSRVITRRWQAAFIGGLIFAFAPNRLGHTLAGHQLLAFNAALPLYTLALYLWLKRPTWRVSSLYIIALILVLLTHPNFIGYFLPLVTAVMFITHWLKHSRFSRKHWQNLFLSWLIAGLVFLPFVWPTLVEFTAQELTYLQPDDVGEHSADLISFFAPSPFHPIWGGQAPSFATSVLDRPRALEEGFNYLGLAALILTGLALWRKWSPAGPWLVMAILAGLLSLGPSLKVGGQSTELSMPYSLLVNLPFFSWSRTPGRFNMTTMLAISILAAIGLAWLIEKYHQDIVRWSLLLGLTGFIIVEYLPMWPFPVDARSISPYYYQLPLAQAQQGLIDMPVSGSRRASNYAMYYQTVHHRPLVGGYIERDPPGTEELRLFADRLLSPPPIGDDIVLMPSLAQRIAILGDLAVSEIAAHRSLMTDQAARATLSFMPTLLGDPYYTDDDLLAWRVPFTTETIQPYTLLLAENGWEAVNQERSLRLKKEGLLFIYAAHSGSAILTIELLGHPSEQPQLWVGDFGPLSTEDENSQYQIPFHLRAKLNWVPFHLTDCEKCEIDFLRVLIKEGHPD